MTGGHLSLTRICRAALIRDLLRHRATAQNAARRHTQKQYAHHAAAPPGVAMRVQDCANGTTRSTRLP